MFIEAAIVIATLGAPSAPSTIIVPVVPRAGYHTVYFFDNLINLTNRVLNRSIRTDVVRVNTDYKTGEVNTTYAQKGQEMVEEHCKVRLAADGIPNSIAECGAGKTR